MVLKGDSYSLPARTYDRGLGFQANQDFSHILFLSFGIVLRGTLSVYPYNKRPA